MCFRMRFWTFLGSIFDQRLVLENRFFSMKKMLNLEAKMEANLDPKRHPLKKIPFALFGTLRTLGAHGRSWSPQGVFWASFGNPLASHGLLVAPPWHPYGFPWAHFGSCWLRAASPTPAPGLTCDSSAVFLASPWPPFGSLGLSGGSL